MDTDSLGWLLALIFYIIAVCGGLYLNGEIAKLEKENTQLKQQIKDYDWQIKQVPYVIEFWCKGE